MNDGSCFTSILQDTIFQLSSFFYKIFCFNLIQERLAAKKESVFIIFINWEDKLKINFPKRTVSSV